MKNKILCLHSTKSKPTDRSHDPSSTSCDFLARAKLGNFIWLKPISQFTVKGKEILPNSIQVRLLICFKAEHHQKVTNNQISGNGLNQSLLHLLTELKHYLLYYVSFLTTRTCSIKVFFSWIGQAYVVGRSGRRRRWALSVRRMLASGEMWFCTVGGQSWRSQVSSRCGVSRERRGPCYVRGNSFPTYGLNGSGFSKGALAWAPIRGHGLLTGGDVIGPRICGYTSVERSI